ncbi:uncharacterized protein LOC112088834 [Eutrema salsugineum]|uniref:uncharacterized protein LOC112088834 n=1 Tax=Eutrema salsugineum TaxID=72664 RepID=UPI000CECF41B|nr:uncharacterized protein LOC112088834 [Eutrema salsugineum]
MPFGLCNAPATFQRCMMFIFPDLIEEKVEVFRDDFSVYGHSFSSCLSNLSQVLERCEEHRLGLNWEKYHFMVQKGILLGHKISEARMKVDRAKVEVMVNMQAPNSVKGIKSFLGILDTAQEKYATTAQEKYATSGQVEVSNRQIKAILERTVSNSRKDWSKKLDDALWAYRTAYKTPIGTSPFNLQLKRRGYSSCMKLKKSDLMPLRVQGYTRNRPRSCMIRKFSRGGLRWDLVLLFNSKLKLFPGKLRARWSGPFRVLEVISYGALVLEGKDGKGFVANGQRVKHYLVSEKREEASSVPLDDPLAC